MKLNSAMSWNLTENIHCLYYSYFPSSESFEFFHIYQSLHCPRSSHFILLVLALVSSKEIPVCFNASMHGSTLSLSNEYSQNRYFSCSLKQSLLAEQQKGLSNSEDEELPGGKDSPH